MPRVRFSVVNAGGAAGATRAAQERLEAKLRAIVSATTDRLRGVVELVAPVDTGFLREHVSAQVSDDGLTGEVGWFASVFTDAGLEFYAPFLEYGTRYQAAQPSLGPAFEEVAPMFAADVEAAVRDAFRDGGAR